MPIVNTKFGENVKIWHETLVNIYDSFIGDGTTIATFVEIGGAKIGTNCKIGCQAYICPETVIGNDVFISHGARFCNVKHPKADVSQKDSLKGAVIKDGATVGAGAVILPGVTVGERALVAAGAVVSRDVDPDTVVAGIPARLIADPQMKLLVSNQKAWMSRQKSLWVIDGVDKVIWDTETENGLIDGKP